MADPTAPLPPRRDSTPSMGYALCQWGFAVVGCLGLIDLIIGLVESQPLTALGGIIALVGGASVCLLAQIAERL